MHRTVAVIKSPELLAMVRQNSGSLQCSDPSELHRHLGDDAIRCVVIEAGVFDQTAFDGIVNALSLSPREVPVLVCWDRGTIALRQVVQSIGAVHSITAAHLRFTLKGELSRVASGRSLPAAVTAIRRVRSLSAARTIDYAAVAAILISDVRRSIADLSDVIGVSPRALSRYCLQRNLPRPVSLLGWSRAIHVVGALEAGVMALDEIARLSLETSARDCSEYLRYHTGAGPTVWLRRGGLDALLSAFAPRLSGVASEWPKFRQWTPDFHVLQQSAAG